MRSLPKKTAPLRVLPCACANLRRASRAVSQLYAEHLRPTGLTMPQFTLLQALALAGELTQAGLGQILVLDSTTLTRTLRPLEDRGWIRRRAGKDRRERRIVLTRTGRAVFRRRRSGVEPSPGEPPRRFSALADGRASWPSSRGSRERLHALSARVECNARAGTHSQIDAYTSNWRCGMEPLRRLDRNDSGTDAAGAGSPRRAP